MATETMTVHEALSELKMLDKRIPKEENSAVFVQTNKHSNSKIAGMAINEYETDIKSSYQKIRDLIKRRTALKRAITQSNAVTTVEIGDERMSVAEAIEYKNYGIDHLERLLQIITNQYEQCKDVIKRNNGDNLEEKASDYVARLFGNKDNANSEAIEQSKKVYIENNTIDLINPLSVEKVIEQLNDEISTFTSKIDSVLSVSNALTTVTINY